MFICWFVLAFCLQPSALKNMSKTPFLCMIIPTCLLANMSFVLCFFYVKRIRLTAHGP